MKIKFTFICEEFETHDMLDPTIEIRVSEGTHIYQRALTEALYLFDREYGDRMEIIHIDDTGLMDNED